MYKHLNCAHRMCFVRLRTLIIVHDITWLYYDDNPALPMSGVTDPTDATVVSRRRLMSRIYSEYTMLLASTHTTINYIGFLLYGLLDS